MSTLSDFSATTITGIDQPLADYAGNVVLVVNTASKCGFTPQYGGLQALYDEFHDDGFDVLGFPCDQFAHQEPGDNADIAEFCSTTYQVTFDNVRQVRRLLHRRTPAVWAVSDPQAWPGGRPDQRERHQVPFRP